MVQTYVRLCLSLARCRAGTGAGSSLHQFREVADRPQWGILRPKGRAPSSLARDFFLQNV